ncbi:hypothetical protein PoB_001227100 [Plakobranchus ocellatus]|uniref:Uncharacterized protein n=1 Tax=Plakobranchus ocellatus TaxID=259542 RepID=A0AAV3YTT1_9GAST|nr:hypothetical protein PoB_001227100 [Plakobranchus ocellatus]
MSPCHSITCSSRTSETTCCRTGDLPSHLNDVLTICCYVTVVNSTENGSSGFRSRTTRALQKVNGSTTDMSNNGEANNIV